MDDATDDKGTRLESAPATMGRGVEASSATKRNPWRIGLLIVHGMGQQQRHQQLAECATALTEELAAGQSTRKPEISYFTHRGKTQKKVVIHLGQHPVRGDVELHVMELYWAQLLRGGTNLLRVLQWFGWAVYRELFPVRRGLVNSLWTLYRLFFSRGLTLELARRTFFRWMWQLYQRLVPGPLRSEVRSERFLRKVHQAASPLPAAVEPEIEPSFERFVWLGIIVLEVFVIVALVVAGVLWFAWVAAANIYWQLPILTAVEVPDLVWPATHLVKQVHPLRAWLLIHWLPFLIFTVSIRINYVLATQGTAPTARAHIAHLSAEPANKPPWYWWVLPLLAIAGIGWGLRVLLGRLDILTPWPIVTGAISWLSEPNYLSWFALTALLTTGLYFWPKPASLRKEPGRPLWLLMWRPIVMLALSLPLLAWAFHYSVIAVKEPHTGGWLKLMTAGLLDRMMMLMHNLAAPFGVILPEVNAGSGLAWWFIFGVLAFALFCVFTALAAAYRAGFQPNTLAQFFFSLLTVASACYLLRVSIGLGSALACLTLLLVAYGLIQLMLVEYFGDIQVFVTQNETNAAFDLRQRILAEAEAQLEHLFGIELDAEGNAAGLSRAAPYHRVAVVAHSTGCPVTYEALSRLMNGLDSQPRAAQSIGRLCQRFRLYVTYGCILEVVKYYFGRRAGSSPLYDRLEQFDQRQHAEPVPKPLATPARFFYCAEWLNLRSLMDPFTWPGLVGFGQRVQTRIIHSMVVPVAAHIQYFGNARFRWELGEAIRRNCL